MNTFQKQIATEGPRNIFLTLTGSLDSGDMTITPAIALTDFSNQSPRQTLSGFRVELVEYSISTPVEILLQWDSAQPQTIINLTGRGRILIGDDYGGLVPDTTRTMYSGNINLITKGATLGNTFTFTIVLALIKLYK